MIELLLVAHGGLWSGLRPQAQRHGGHAQQQTELCEHGTQAQAVCSGEERQVVERRRR